MATSAARAEALEDPIDPAAEALAPTWISFVEDERAIDIELPGWAPEGYVYVEPDGPRPAVLPTVAKLLLTVTAALTVSIAFAFLVGSQLLSWFFELFPKLR
jgi:hypothetical protein